jgi:spermidine/putrescine transport system permease protein
MVLYSFQRENSGNFTIYFTFEHYQSFFQEIAFVSKMGESILLSFIATVICLLICFPLAYIISRKSAKAQALLVLGVTSTMWINLLLRTLALGSILEIFIPANKFGSITMLIGMVYMYIPFMFLPIYSSLHKLDNSYIESAHDLGADNFFVMVKVVLPLSLSGIFSGILMTFLPAATSLVIPKYLGNSSKLIGDLIENAMIKDGRFGYGAAIALVLSVIMMIIVYFVKKMDRYSGALDEEK